MLEYKAPGDSLSVGDYNKVFGYAYIYAYLEKIDIRGVTVSFVTTARPESVLTYLSQRPEICVDEVSNGIHYVRNEIMPVQILTTKYLNKDENLWLTSLTDSIIESHFEKVVQEREKLTTNINALLYALAVANAELLKEGYEKMGASLEAVLAEIGFVERSILEKIENEKKQMTIKANEKIAKLAVKAELAESEKDRIARQAEKDKARLKQAEDEKAQLIDLLERDKNNRLENAIDMLRSGTPVATVAKWTNLPEDEIQRLQADIDLSIN